MSLLRCAQAACGPSLLSWQDPTRRCHPPHTCISAQSVKDIGSVCCCGRHRVPSLRCLIYVVWFFFGGKGMGSQVRQRATSTSAPFGVLLPAAARGRLVARLCTEPEGACT